MQLLELKLCNFLPYYGEVTLDFTEMSSATITGPNMGGKSSLIDAILFALKGKARKKPEGLINDLCTSMYVELSFEKNGGTYTVHRSIERDKKQKIKLFLNNEDISERLLSANQEKLDRIINVSYELLLNTSVAQQGQIDSFFSKLPSEREVLINEMLMLTYWEDKKRTISEKISLLETKRSSLEELEVELSTLEYMLEDNSSNLEDYQVLLDVKRKQLDLLKEKQKLYLGYYEQHKERNSILERITKLTSIRDEINRHLTESPSKVLIASGLQYAQIESNEIDTKLEVILKFKEYLETVLAEILYRKQTASYTFRFTNSSILDEVPCKDTKYFDQCKLLSQAKIDREDKQKFLENYGFYDGEQALDVLEAQYTVLSRRLQKLKDHEKVLRSSAVRTQVEVESFTLRLSDIEQAEKDHQRSLDLSREISDLKEKLQYIPEVDLIELSNLESDLKICSRDIEQYQEEINQTEKTIEGLANKKPVLEKQIQALNKEIGNFHYYQTLEKAYSEIPSLLFSRIKPTIEDYANEILRDLSPNEKVELRSHRDTKKNTLVKSFDVLLKTSTGTREIEDISGSQRFRVSLALRLALAKVNAELYNVDVDFFIVDEGFGSLDENNIQLIKRTLKQVSDTFKLFLVITHIEELKDTFEVEIKIHSNGGVSNLGIQKHENTDFIVELET